jgi:actin related protein 2/3 complex, subunit 5
LHFFLHQTLKEKAAQFVVRVLTSFKNAEIESAIKTLSADEVDLLMKYIYKGMELQQDGQTCASLLAWHAQVLRTYPAFSPKDMMKR